MFIDHSPPSPHYLLQDHPSPHFWFSTTKRLLTRLVIDDIIPSVKPFSFRQWVACVTMVAVLFGTMTPFGFCLCEGCHCENSISRLLPSLALSDTAAASGRCCCTPPEPLPEGCCGSPTPCSCSCGDTQDDVAVSPAVLPAKQPKIVPSWNIVSVIPVDFARVFGQLSLSCDHRAMPLPHVPLHVLLCVFLN